MQAQIPPGLGPGAQFTIAVPAAVQQQHGPDTAVGVVEEGGLQGVLRGLDGVVYFPRKDMLAGQDFTVHATDQVVDVFALDRAMFDAANAASGASTCATAAPHVDALNCAPQEGLLLSGLVGRARRRAPAAVLSPVRAPLYMRGRLGHACFLAAALRRALCSPHKDVAWPPWADRALILTDRGVIGRPRTDAVPHEKDVNGILWENVDLESTRQSVRVYATSPTCYCDNKFKFNKTLPVTPHFRSWRWIRSLWNAALACAVPACSASAASPGRLVCTTLR